MSAITTLTLLDGAATPVSRTFAPVGIDPQGVAKFTDRSGGIALGYPTATQSLRQPSKSSRNYRISLKLVLPTLEVTSPSTSTGIQPAPTKAYELFATIDLVMSERSALLERNNLLALTKSFLASANVTNAVQNFETIY